MNPFQLLSFLVSLNSNSWDHKSHWLTWGMAIPWDGCWGQRVISLWRKIEVLLPQRRESRCKAGRNNRWVPQYSRYTCKEKKVWNDLWDSKVLTTQAMWRSSALWGTIVPFIRCEDFSDVLGSEGQRTELSFCYACRSNLTVTYHALVFLWKCLILFSKLHRLPILVQDTHIHCDVYTFLFTSNTEGS